MLRAIRVEGGQPRQGGREVCAPGAPLWVDLSPGPEDLHWLGERFGFHPLALEDCAHEDQLPKNEEYPGAIFCVVHRLGPTPDDSDIQSLELHAFLTADALVTVHSAPIAELDRVFERVAQEPALLGRGPDFLLHLVYDEITNAHFAVADALSTEVDELAAEATSATLDGDLMERILEVRGNHALLRRRLAPQREVFAALARAAEPLVRKRNAPYFRDVLDHVLRITEQLDAGRDLLGSVMDVYVAMQDNRLNALTTRLTLVATIFLPLNFLVGFFGMNLDIFPAPLAKAVVLVTVVTLPAAMWGLFRRKRLL